MISDSRSMKFVQLKIWKKLIFKEKKVCNCDGRESNPGQLLGRQLCSPLYHHRMNLHTNLHILFNFYHLMYTYDNDLRNCLTEEDVEARFLNSHKVLMTQDRFPSDFRRLFASSTFVLNEINISFPFSFIFKLTYLFGNESSYNFCFFSIDSVIIWESSLDEGGGILPDRL